MATNIIGRSKVTKEQCQSEILKILELDPSEQSQKMVDLVIDDGRKALRVHQDDLGGRVFREEIESDSGELLSLLKHYVESNWYENTPSWFHDYLQRQQTDSSELYDQVLIRSANYGSKFVKGNLILSLTIQFLFELTDSAMLETTIFDEIWKVLVTNGRQGIALREDDLPAKLLKEQLETPESILFLALKNFYEDSVTKILKNPEINICREKIISIVLNCVTEFGWWKGLHDSKVEDEIAKNKRKIIDQKLLEYLEHEGLPMPSDASATVKLENTSTSSPSPICSQAVSSEEPTNSSNPSTEPKSEPTLQDTKPQVASSKSLITTYKRDKECELIQRFVTDEKLTLTHLVMAGELKYLDQTLNDVLKRIIEDYMERKCFTSFIRACNIPVMYLLKRHQNLDDFMDGLIQQYNNLDASLNKYQISLRMLIDVLMISSNFSTSRKMMILLSKRNPVPFVQPNLTDETSFRFVSDIIHVWDFLLPTILSFGIGPCEGKSTLLNSLLLCSFETSSSSIYFCNTIDIDFGYNFLPRRSMSIADAHGSMEKTLLKKIHSLFNGFLIHVTYRYLIENLDHVLNQLDLIDEPGKYRLLLVRDTTPINSDGDQLITQLNNLVSNKAISVMFTQRTADGHRGKDAMVLTFFLTDMRNDKDRLVKSQQTTLRNQLLNELPRKCQMDEYSISLDLKKLMEQGYKEHLEIVQKTIKIITEKLIDAAADKGKAKKYFPEYSTFVKLCEYQLTSARFNFYGSENDKEVYAARQNICRLKEILDKKHDSFSVIFKLFLGILEKDDLITCLELLCTQLKEKQAHHVLTSEMAMRLPIEKSLSLEFLWRNAIVCSNHHDERVQQLLHRRYSDYVKAGFPFEIVDGDNFFFQKAFLKKSLAPFKNDRALVVSIIGPQNSGKSTLLNYMFGTLFDVRDGRCTRGIYGSFVKATGPNYDYILLIDTEGLLSIEREDKEYDRRIVLFCLAVSHIVIVNMSGEFSTTLQDMLKLCASSLKELGVSTIPRPIVHFVLNQRADLNIENHHASIRKVIADLERDGLKDWIDLREQTFHALPSAFKKEGQTLTSNAKLGNVVKTAPEFIECVQKLTEQILHPTDPSLDRKSEIGTPLEWLQSSFTVFDTVRKFPDLTYYQDINERRIDNELREKARNYLMKIFSGDYRNEFIVESLNKDQKSIKESIAVRRNHVQNLAEEEMERWFKSSQVPETLRKRTRDFIRTQIIQMFSALYISIMAANERERIRLLVQNGEGDLKKLIEETVQSGKQMSADEAAKEFKKMYEMTIQSITNRYIPDERLKQAMQHIFTNYNIYEKDFRFEYEQLIRLEECLRSLNETKLSINELEHGFVLKFTQLGYENPSINALTYSPSGSTIYSLEIIRKLFFLNKNLLQREFERFFATLHSQHQSTEQKKGAVRRFVVAMSETFSSERKDHKDQQAGVLGSTDKFQAEIRELIKKNSSQLPTSTHYGYDEQSIYLPVSNLITEVFKRILEAMKIPGYNKFRKIRPEIIQKVVGLISSLIIEVRTELAPFCLELSRSLKSVLHTCAIILLTKCYYDEQMNHFFDTLNELTKKERNLQHYFIQLIVPNSTSDQNFALNLIQQLRDSLLKHFTDESQQIIRDILKQYEYINRKWAQDKCDGLLLSKDDISWNLDYINNPNKIIEQCFKNLWMDIERAINQQLTEQKSKYIALVENFYFCLNGMLETSQKLGAPKTLVDWIFLPEATSNLDAQQHLANKHKCMASVFEQYFVKKSIQRSIRIDGQVYTLRSGALNLFQNLLRQRTPAENLPKIMADLKETLDKISIVNFVDFLTRLIGYKDKVIKDVEQFKTDFKSIDRQDTYETLLDQVRGCTTLCPCCKRPCDVDHTQIKSNPGSEQNEHCCLTGHSLRAMNGYKLEETGEASLFMCEQIKDDQEIVIGPTRYQWSQFKKDHPEWKFESTLGEDELGRQHGKYLTIWTRIGPKICSLYGMNFVTRNEVSILKYQPFHYMLLLDASGSMNEHGRWNHLMEAVKKFLECRQALATNDRFTIIPFNGSAKAIYENEPFDKIDTATLQQPSGNTSFSKAFQCAIDTLKKLSKEYPSDPVHKNIAILFMSDGEAHYPERELNKLHEKYDSIIKRFWTIALCDENSHHKALFEQINTKMNGSFYNVESAALLTKAYAEVASVMQ